MAQEGVVSKKSFEFALSVIELCQELRNQHQFRLSDQLFRSGTSIGANVEEAGAAQSRKDFISKMAIASKESRETRYWLRLIQESQSIKLDVSSYLRQVDELVRLLTAIVKTTSTSDYPYPK